MSPTPSLLPIRGGAELGPVALQLDCGDLRVLLDCGASAGAAANWVEEVDGVDGVWVSHAHYDHCGGLPDMWEGRPRLDCVATPATARLAGAILEHHPDAGTDRASDLGAGIRRVGSGSSFEFPKIRSPRSSGLAARAAAAGHVLGAAMLSVDVAGHRLAYTGDFCLHDQKVVSGADLEALGDGRIDTLVMEGVLATDDEADDADYSRSLEQLVDWCVCRDGPVLVAAQASGEAVELAAALAEASDEVCVESSLEPVLGAYRHAKHLASLDVRPEPELAATLADGGVAVAPADQFDVDTPSNRLAGGILEREDARIATTNRAYESTPAGALFDAAPGDRLRSFESAPVKRAEARRFVVPTHAPRRQLLRTVEHLDPGSVVLVHGRESRLHALRRALRDAGFDRPISVLERGERFELDGR